MELLSNVILLISALGIGSLLTKGVDYFLERRSKKGKEERDGWRLYDQESDRRRAYEEVLHKTRLDWHNEHGKSFKDMPNKPEIDRTPPSK